MESQPTTNTQKNENSNKNKQKGKQKALEEYYRSNFQHPVQQGKNMFNLEMQQANGTNINVNVFMDTAKLIKDINNLMNLCLGDY